jgi:PAS domain S-box-containing protein
MNLCESLPKEIMEVKPTEETLLEAGQRIINILESISDAFYTLDSEWRFTYLNSAAERLLQRPGGELIGKSVWIEFPQSLETAFYEVYQRVAAERVAASFVEFYPPFNRWFEVRAYPSKDGVSVYFRDITDEKRASEALRESEERYRLLSKATNNVIWDWDMVSGDVVWDEAICSVFNLKTEDVGYTIAWWSDHIHPEDLSRVRANIHKVIDDGGKSWSDEYRFQNGDGSYATVLDCAYLTRDESGVPLRAIGAMLDLSERRKAQTQRRDADRRALTEYDRLLSRLGSLAQALGSARDLTTVYRALCKFSIASAPISGLAITIHYPEKQARQAVYFWTEAEGEVLPEDLPQIPVGDGPVGQAIRSGEIVVIEDYEKVVANRKQVWVGKVNHNVVRPALIAPMAIMGKVTGTVEIQNFAGDKYQSEHVTAMRMAANMAASAIENVRLLEHERQQDEKLQQSQKMEAIGTLAGGVAHDFNNLLTVIIGNTQLAFNKLQPADAAWPRLVEVDKAANRAAVLTRQLLAFSRRQQMERRNIKLNDIVGETVKLLNRIIGADVEVNVKLGVKLSAVFADPAQIEQVVMNLVVNARDAMPEGGQLTIETANITLDESYQRQYAYILPGNYVELRVSDTGCGMNEATKARLFEPFFTTKDIGKGTGLGLSMVYGIVKQHDGYISVYSELGQGTTFKIFLPVVEDVVETPTLPVQPELIGGGETILVAEDEEGLRHLAGDVLSELGYKVLLAKDGEEAVQVYRKNQESVDMLLLDVMMPRMGGIEAYESIRKIGGEIPLIFMTGYSPEVVQSRFVKQNLSIEKLGLVVIQKPYSVDGLGRKIREVLDNAKLKAKSLN